MEHTACTEAPCCHCKEALQEPCEKVLYMHDMHHQHGRVTQKTFLRLEPRSSPQVIPSFSWER